MVYFQYLSVASTTCNRLYEASQDFFQSQQLTLLAAKHQDFINFACEKAGFKMGKWSISNINDIVDTTVCDVRSNHNIVTSCQSTGHENLDKPYKCVTILCQYFVSKWRKTSKTSTFKMFLRIVLRVFESSWFFVKFWGSISIFFKMVLVFSKKLCSPRKIWKICVFGNLGYVQREYQYQNFCLTVTQNILGDPFVFKIIFTLKKCW